MTKLEPKFHESIDLDTFNFRHEKFSELIPEDSIVLDIGAHVGMFSLIFGSCVPKGKVLAFEPNPKTFEVLTQNSKSNPTYNIQPYNYAATIEDGEYTSYYSDPKIYGSGINGGNFNDIELGESIKKSHSTPVKIKGVNIYNFLQENHKDEMDKIKFIKTDMEGFDKEVLKTLSSLIEKNKPILMVEAFKDLTNKEMKEFYDILKSFNYEIYDVSPLDNQTDCVGPISEEEFSFYIRNVVDNGNFFCFPKEDVKKYNLPIIVPGKTACIVFGRNDGYKEAERFKIHITTLLETFDEVVYIDWNSPNQSFLYEIIDELPKTGRLKHFIIPPKYADMMVMNDPNAQVCNTVISFNLGIRRTDAEWIVVSTTDIIPPRKEVLDNFISEANKNTFYTLSRRDIEYNDVIQNLDRLDDYRKELDQTTKPRYFPAKVTPNDNWSIFNCCGDFQLAHHNIWYKIRGYEEQMLYACFVDTNVQKKSTLYGFNLQPIYDIPLYHMSHKGMKNDGSSPSKQYYNNALEWVEYFGAYKQYQHIMYSRNADTWGYSNVDIEYETI